MNPVHRTALRANRSLRRRTLHDPARFVPWLPNQYRFLASKHRRRQIRQGNQFGGKTTAALAEVVGRCVGRHPLGAPHWYPHPHAEYEWWIICDTWGQSVAIMGKLWAMLPLDDVDRKATTYSKAKGIKGKHPCVVFKNGAVIRVKTTNQDPGALASGTIDGALFDEPPADDRSFTEVQNRLMQRGGILLLAYTPVNRPVAYLKEKVDAGIIEDHWTALTAEALIPVGHTRPLRGADGVLHDQAWIDELRRITSAYEANIVLDGEWEYRVKGNWFDGAWDERAMVHANLPEGNVKIWLGIDYGNRPGKQCAYLGCQWTNRAGQDCVYVLDEYCDETGTAVTEDDAKGVLEMLKRNNIGWHPPTKKDPNGLDFAHGDRVHMQGSAQQKSNNDLMKALCKLLRRQPRTLMPPIETVKRGEGRNQGSPMVGSRWLFALMVKGRFGVNPRCKRLIAAIPKFHPKKDDDNKDPIDALRYGLDPWVFEENVAPGPTLYQR